MLAMNTRMRRQLLALIAALILIAAALSAERPHAPLADDGPLPNAPFSTWST